MKKDNLVSKTTIAYLDRVLLKLAVRMFVKRPRQSPYETIYNQMQDNARLTNRPMLIMWEKNEPQIGIKKLDDKDFIRRVNGDFTV